jgi:hypothetical protein
MHDPGIDPKVISLGVEPLHAPTSSVRQFVLQHCTTDRSIECLTACDRVAPRCVRDVGARCRTLLLSKDPFRVKSESHRSSPIDGVAFTFPFATETEYALPCFSGNERDMATSATALLRSSCANRP